MRHLFRIFLTLTLSLSFTLNAAVPKSLFASKKPDNAKYVFLFIGDGMGMGAVMAANTYLRLVRPNEKPLLMTTFPVASQVMTYSANRYITDSSASGTALSTGQKVNNYTVGVDVNGNPIPSITTDFMKAGYEVGVATNVTLDDATPSAFYAHAKKRTAYPEIDMQIPTSGLKFLGGSLFRGLESDPSIKPALDAALKKNGYNVVNGFSEFLSLPSHSGKTIMTAVNPDGHNSGYTIDSVPGHTTMPEFTQACLMTLRDNLKADKAPGFFMMVEGGNIDWAAHANDGGAVIKEILNFQEGIDIAYRFYLDHPNETLIVVTADHDTGGIALGRNDNGKGNFKLADYQRISKEKFEDLCRKEFIDKGDKNWSDMEKVLRDKLGFWQNVPITEKETERLKSAFDRTFIARNAQDTKTLYKDFNNFAVIVFDTFNKHLGLGYTTNDHSGNMVPLYAIGVGADLFKGNINNSDVPMLILKAAGLERNKSQK